MKKRNFIITSAGIIGGTTYISRGTQDVLAVDYSLGQPKKDIEHDTGIQIGFDGLLLYEEGLDVSSNDLTITMKSKVLEDSAPDAFNTIDSRTYDTTTTYDGKTIAERIDDQEDVSADIKNQDSNNGEFLLSTVKYNDGTRNELYNLIKDKDPGVELDVDVEVKFKFEIGSTSKESTMKLRLTILKEIINSNTISSSDFSTEIKNGNVYSDGLDLIFKPKIQSAYDGELEKNDVVIAEKRNGTFRQQKISNFTQIGSSDGSTNKIVNILIMADLSGSMSGLGGEWGDTLQATYEFANDLPSEFNFAFGGFSSGTGHGYDGLVGEKSGSHVDPDMEIGDYDKIDGYDGFVEYMKDKKDVLNRSYIETSVSETGIQDLWTFAENKFSEAPGVSSDDYLIVMGDGDHFETGPNPENYDFDVIGFYFDGGGTDPQDIAEVSSVDKESLEEPYPDQPDVNKGGYNTGSGEREEKLLFFDARNVGGNYSLVYNKIKQKVSGEYQIKFENSIGSNLGDRDILIRVYDPNSDKKSQVVFNSGSID